MLGNEDDPERNGGVRVDYRYSSFALNNRADAIHLHDRAGNLVDSVVYDARLWPVRPGRSLAYCLAVPDALHNDLPRSWRSSSRPMSGGDRGTPGAPGDG